MEQEYKFIFPGTREDLLNKLKPFPNNYEEYYYFDGYIVDLRDNEIRFGVARGGHSGGYWFNPTVTEIGGRMEFRGTIRRVGLEDNRSPKQKLVGRMEKIILMVLFWPVLLPIMLYIRINMTYEDEAAFEEAAADQYEPTLPPPGTRDRRGRFFRS